MGTETGLIKCINPEDAGNIQSVLNKNESQSRDRYITQMLWGDSKSESDIVVAYRDGTIEGLFPSNGDLKFKIYRGLAESASQQQVKLVTSSLVDVTLRNSINAKEKETIVGDNEYTVKGIFSEQLGNERQILLVNEKGKLESYRFEIGNSTTAQQEIKKQEYNLIDFCKKSSPLQVASMKFLRLDSSTIHGACVGRETVLQIFDIEQQRQIFKSRREPNGDYDIRTKIWEKDLGFLNIPGGNILATCSAYSKFKIYDKRAGDKPVMLKRFNEDNVCCSAMGVASETNPDPYEIYIGETRGKAYQYYFGKQKPKQLATYFGHAGTVRQIVNHPTAPEYVISVGADRYMRVYDRTDRNQVHSVYTVHKLTCLLVSKELPTKRIVKKTEFTDDDLLVKPERRRRETVKQETEENLNSDEEEENNNNEQLDDKEEEDGENVSSDEDEELWDELKTVSHKDKKATKKRKQDQIEESEPQSEDDAELSNQDSKKTQVKPKEGSLQKNV